jgi:hypothetical protein
MRFPISITHNFLLEPVLATFGVNRENSFVEIDAESLHVKMGRWFDERVPLSAIAALAPADWPWWGGLGVKLAHHGVAVVGSTEGVVNLRLDPKVKMRVLVSVEAEQLWISLDDRDAFTLALSEAIKKPISPHVPF